MEKFFYGQYLLYFFLCVNKAKATKKENHRLYLAGYYELALR